MPNRSPGPDEQYCPNCRAIVSRKAEMCPECNTFDVSPGAPSTTGGAAHRADATGGSTAATGRAGSPSGVEAVGRGHLFAVAGGVSLLLSVLTLVLAYLLTFSFFVGVLVLPLSGLFGIVRALYWLYELLQRIVGVVAIVAG